MKAKWKVLSAVACLTLFAAEDRVGYPKDYQTVFTKVRISDRADTKTTAVIYANAAGATIRPADPGP